MDRPPSGGMAADLMDLPLVKRKATFRRPVQQLARVLYGDHITGAGGDLYDALCAQNLEGLVAKWKHDLFRPGEQREPGEDARRNRYTGSLPPPSR